MFIGEINNAGSNKEDAQDWKETVMINNYPIIFKLDTGAQCNVLPKYLYDRISQKELDNTNVRLKSYTKEIIKPLGQTVLLCNWRGEKRELVFQVITGDYSAIIGKHDCVNLNMITRNIKELKTEEDFLEEYKEVFEGNGHLPGDYRINLDASIPQVINPPRKVPFALEDKLKTELNRMEKEGILKKVPNNEPTDWVHSLVTVTKPNGEVRICIDPKNLNRAIKREHHPLCTLEEIASKVHGAKYFSVLDAEKAFYQIKLDEESSKLLTFNTPFGRYRYLRMPMGISSATEIYQRRAEEVFENCKGVKTSIDDTLVWGCTEEEHDDRLKKALEKAKTNNLKLNKRKCQIKKTEVRFLGHIFTDQGLKPDEQKCKAIREMRQPENVADIQRLLGMLNYESKFIPNLSELTAPLRQLLNKETEWHWTPEINDCFIKLKEVLTNPPVLAYYNPNAKLTLQVDASSKGLGACLLQEGRPIAYASKALTMTQQAYSQMEKEMLAILFGCTKYDTFITGRDTTVETDHKPLESIMQKPLHTAPLRLQRMMIQLQRYPRISVVYKKGTEMVFADALSRAFLQEYLEGTEELELDNLEVLPMSEAKIKQFMIETKEDVVLQILKKQINEGWPNKIKDIPKEITPYWNYREELSVVKDLIFKGLKVVVPKSIRTEMLDKLHESHMGIVKTKQRARDIFYWPGMSNAIEEKVKNCPRCLTFQSSNTKEPLLSHKIPDRPWAKVGSDLFILNGKIIYSVLTISQSFQK